MNTCQNPKCGAKQKNRYCSAYCYKQVELVKVKYSKVRKEKYLWQEFWRIKSRYIKNEKFTYPPMFHSIEEKTFFDTQNYIWLKQPFENIRHGL